jgi:hypothetical protein
MIVSLAADNGDLSLRDLKSKLVSFGAKEAAVFQDVKVRVCAKMREMDTYS